MDTPKNIAELSRMFVQDLLELERSEHYTPRAIILYGAAEEQLQTVARMMRNELAGWGHIIIIVGQQASADNFGDQAYAIDVKYFLAHLNGTLD